MGAIILSCFKILIITMLLIHKGIGLQCYNCHAAIRPSEDDPCQNAALETCPAASTRCLSAKFSVQSRSQQEVISALTCFPDMKGEECDYFLEKVQQRTPSSVRIQFLGKCNLCSTDGCNAAGRLSSYIYLNIFCFIFAIHLKALQ